MSGEMRNRKWVIVENAGYIGECDIATCSSYREALHYQNSHYDADEREELHVDIRQDWTDDDGDHQEYVC
jgi:hypothetical protein